MKKKALFFVILIFSLSAVVFAGRKEVEDFFKAFERVVAEAEKLAKRPSLTEQDLDQMMKLLEEMDTVTELADGDPTYGEQDELRLEKLSERFEKAIEIITSKLK